MELVSFLLHCSSSNLVLEILKHDKISGQFALTYPTANYVGTRPHIVPMPSPVIYAHIANVVAVSTQIRTRCRPNGT